MVFGSQAELEDRLDRVVPGYRVYGAKLWQRGIRSSDDMAELTGALVPPTVPVHCTCSAVRRCSAAAGPRVRNVTIKVCLGCQAALHPCSLRSAGPAHVLARRPPGMGPTSRATLKRTVWQRWCALCGCAGHVALPNTRPRILKQPTLTARPTFSLLFLMLLNE